MPRFRVVLDDEAQKNVEGIYQWIAARSTDGATRWYLALHSALDRLASDPERFAVAPESRHFEEIVRNVTFRMRSGRRYRILFTLVGNDVHVLFVRGPGQDWATP